MVGAGITSFYMSRLFFMIFHGEKRWTTEFDGGSDVHPHEASWLMNGPIVVLSVFSLAMGMVLGFTDKFTQWLEPVTGTAAATENASVSVLSHAAISVITLILVLCGLALAFVMYVRKPVPKVAPASNALVEAARVGLYQDTVNESVAMLPAQLLTVGVGGADRGLIDGIVRGIAWCAGALGRALSHVQNGYIRAYASYILGGVLLALVLVVGSQLV